VRLHEGTVESDYQRWLRSYLRHLKYKDVSRNTFETYTRILGKLQSYISDQSRIKIMQDMDREFFLDFIEHCEERSKRGNFSKKTKQLYISVLKSFFNYISDHNDEMFSYSNELKISIAGTNKGKKVKYLTDEEIGTILEHLDHMRYINGTYSDYIYSLGIKLMLYGGLRISEVLQLKMYDITISDLRDNDGNRDMYEINLSKTKSGEEQTALVKIENIRDEIEYFKSIREPDEYIFKSRTKKALLHRSNFYVKVKKIMRDAGIDKKGLHIYRHTCAMQLYRKTKDILVTKEKLRHSDIKTTMVYARAEKSDIANAMR